MRDNYKLSERKKREKKPKVDPEAEKIRVAVGLLQSLKEAIAMEQGKIKGREISRKLPNGLRIIFNKFVKKYLK